MYSISWYNCSAELCCVIGELHSVCSVAAVLEQKKWLFKVASVDGYLVSQGDCGCGDFTCWQKPEARGAVCV